MTRAKADNPRANLRLEEEPMSVKSLISWGAAGSGLILGWAACSGSDSGNTGSGPTTVGGGGSTSSSTTSSPTGPTTTSTATNTTGTAGAGGGGPTVSGGMGGVGAGGTAGTGAGGQPPAGTNVTQYHNNLSRDGLYIDAAFTKAKAAMIHKDAAFNATIMGPTFAQPLYFEGAAGGQNLVIAATLNSHVYALDAATGMVVWQKQVATAAPIGSFGCGDMAVIGIVGTPVIDAASKTIFFDSAQTGPVRKIYALSLDDGSEKAGWPVDVIMNAKAGATAFNPLTQSQRAAPTLVNGVLYVPYGGIIGDCNPYHGWVVGVPINAPTQVKAFATGAERSGIWGPGGIASDGTDLFVVTGNGLPGSAFGQQESILRLQAGPTFNNMPANFFVPSNW